MKKPTEKRLTKAQRAVFADWMEENLPVTAAQRARVLKAINPGAQVAQAGSIVTHPQDFARNAQARAYRYAAARVRSDSVGMAQVASVPTLRGQRLRADRMPPCRKPPGASSR